MIDLRHQLPTGIELGGELFLFDTDFRTWIEFLRIYEDAGVAWSGVFSERVPDGDEWVEPALEFAMSKNSTPTGSEGSAERALDFIEDGDYLVGSFWQAYGINLAEIEYMHWHVFLALFRSLPSSTKIMEIMSYRTFKESDLKEKPIDRYKKARSRWKLPVKKNEAVLSWQEQMFGNIPIPEQANE